MHIHYQPQHTTKSDNHQAWYSYFNQDDDRHCLSLAQHLEKCNTFHAYLVLVMKQLSKRLKQNPQLTMTLQGYLFFGDYNCLECLRAILKISGCVHPSCSAADATSCTAVAGRMPHRCCCSNHCTNLLGFTIGWLAANRCWYPPLNAGPCGLFLFVAMMLH